MAESQTVPWSDSSYNWGKMRFDVTSCDWETVGEHVLFWDSHGCEEEEEEEA